MHCISLTENMWRILYVILCERAVIMETITYQCETLYFMLQPFLKGSFRDWGGQKRDVSWERSVGNGLKWKRPGLLKEGEKGLIVVRRCVVVTCMSSPSYPQSVQSSKHHSLCALFVRGKEMHTALPGLTGFPCPSPLLLLILLNSLLSAFQECKDLELHNTFPFCVIKRWWLYKVLNRKIMLSCILYDRTDWSVLLHWFCFQHLTLLYGLSFDLMLWNIRGMLFHIIAALNIHSLTNNSIWSLTRSDLNEATVDRWYEVH